MSTVQECHDAIITREQMVDTIFRHHRSEWAKDPIEQLPLLVLAQTYKNSNQYLDELQQVQQSMYPMMTFTTNLSPTTHLTHNGTNTNITPTNPNHSPTNPSTLHPPSTN